MPTGVYLHKKGKQSPRWKGGKVQHGGYIAVYAPGHPRASAGNGFYVLEHVLIAEKALGRALPKKAEVHHADENKSNNKPCNLVICQDAAYHRLLHLRTTALRAFGDVNARRCSHCKKWETDLSRGSINSRAFRHRSCHAVYMQQQRKARVEGLINSKL